MSFASNMRVLASRRHSLPHQTTYPIPTAPAPGCGIQYEQDIIDRIIKETVEESRQMKSDGLMTNSGPFISPLSMNRSNNGVMRRRNELKGGYGPAYISDDSHGSEPQNLHPNMIRARSRGWIPNAQGIGLNGLVGAPPRRRSTGQTNSMGGGAPFAFPSQCVDQLVDGPRMSQPSSAIPRRVSNAACADLVPSFSPAADMYGYVLWFVDHCM